MTPTNGVLDSQSVQLSFRQTAPHLRLVDLVGVVDASVQADYVFYKDVDGVRVLLVFLEYQERFFVESMVDSDLSDFRNFVVLKFIDVVDDFTLVCTDGSQHKKVLQILVVAKW